MSLPPASTYQPLTEYLAAQAADTVTISLPQIEAILGAALPASAYLPEWWLSQTARFVQVQGWRLAGWHATDCTTRDGDQWVTFVRSARARAR